MKAENDMKKRSVNINTEEVEQFFSVPRRAEAIQRLAECKEFDRIVSNAFNQLVGFYEKEKRKAPKTVAERIENQLAKYELRGKEILGYDALQSLKMNLYVYIVLGQGTPKEAATAQKMLSELEAGNYEPALTQIQNTCDQFVKIIPLEFFNSVRNSLIEEAIYNGDLSVLMGNFGSNDSAIRYLTRKLEERSSQEKDLEIVIGKTPEKSPYNPK